MTRLHFNRYLYKYWKLEVVIILLGLVTLPFSLLNPYLTKLVLDSAYKNKDLKLFLILAIISGSIFIFNSLMNSLSGYILKYVNRKVNYDITKDLFKHLHGLSLVFFSNRSTGEHIYKVNDDVNLISSFVCDIIPRALELFPRFLFIIVISFYLNWELTLFAMLLIPINFIYSYFFGKWTQGVMRQLIEESQNVFIRLHEAFSHIWLVKALGKEDYEMNRFNSALSKMADLEVKSAKISNTSDFLDNVLNKIVVGLIALYGGYQIIRGVTTLGSLMAVMIYLTQLTAIIAAIGKFYETILVSSISRRRIVEILNTEAKIQDAPDAANHRILLGRIEFKDIVFGYSQGKSILRNINFSIAAASKIAFVGRSGCGKTTLLSLMLRLYDVESGVILVDGMDIRKIRMKSLREEIGIALQEPFLWNDTVANNIAYGAEGAKEEEITWAAKIAEAHNFILGLPKQYDSVIGENACKISEGQKQRVAIARALIKKPKILILDEALSSVDSDTEDRIIDSIKREFKETTLIIVSHRLSTVKKMELVYFLQSPSAMKIGTNESLLKECVSYKELFVSQSTEEQKLNLS